MLADADRNQSEDEDTPVSGDRTETEPCQNISDHRQVKETTQTANVQENLPNHIVRRKRNRKQRLRFGYYASGNPALGQYPKVGMVQVGDTRTPTFSQQPMNPVTQPFPQQTVNPITPPFPKQPMNSVTPPFPMCYGIPPPFGYYQVY